MNSYAEAGLSFNDTERMQTQFRESARLRRWIPAWANSDFKMRRVLAQRCWMYVSHFGRSKRFVRIVPDALVNDRVALAKLIEDFVAREHKWKHVRGLQGEIHKTHLDIIERTHGYLTLQCAVVYRAYRMGMDSVGIAEGFGISPAAVRQYLARANDAARKLGYETFPRHGSAGKKRPKFVPVTKRTRLARVEGESNKDRRARLKAAHICTACQCRPTTEFAECNSCRKYYAELARKRKRAGSHFSEGNSRPFLAKPPVQRGLVLQALTQPN